MLENPTRLLFLAMLMVWHTCQAAYGDAYEGKIGSIPVWMDLTLPSGDGLARGTYFYKKVGTSIPLEAVRKGNQLTMMEYDKAGRMMAHFICSMRGDSLLGRWGKGEKDSVYPVALSKTDPARRISAKGYRPLPLYDARDRKSKSEKIFFDRETLFDGKGYGWLHGCRKSSDGYLITGVDSSKPVFIKLFPNGLKAWEKSYPLGEHELHSARESKDGGYLLLGITMGEEEYEGFMLKLAPDGKEVWKKNFQEQIKGVLETPEGYILVGSFQGLACMIRTDRSGNTVHRSTYKKKPDLNSWNAIIQVPSGFLAAGDCREGQADYGWVGQVNGNLEITKDKIYPDQGMHPSDIISTGPNEYLVTGMIDIGSYHAFLQSIDANLETRWKVTLTGGDNELTPTLHKGKDIVLLSGNGATNATWISKIDVVLPKSAR